MDSFTKRLGPLPLWGWFVAVGGAGLVLILVMKHKPSKPSATSASSGPQTSGYDPLAPVGTTPSSLYGSSPMPPSPTSNPGVSQGPGAPISAPGGTMFSVNAAGHLLAQYFDAKGTPQTDDWGAGFVPGTIPTVNPISPTRFQVSAPMQNGELNTFTKDLALAGVMSSITGTPTTGQPPVPVAGP